MYGYRGERPPERFNMARYCLETGNIRPVDKIGLIVIKNADDLSATETWTYGELEDAVLRIAAGLTADLAGIVAAVAICWLLFAP